MPAGGRLVVQAGAPVSLKCKVDSGDGDYGLYIAPMVTMVMVMVMVVYTLLFLNLSP